MTREQAKELLPIITAFAEGKNIQWLLPDDTFWRDIEDDDIQEPMENYKWRIKPEPREFWLVDNNEGRAPFSTVLYSKPTEYYKNHHLNCTILHIKEVIE